MKKKFRLTLNAPVILIFCALCLIIQIINAISGGSFTHSLFTVYRTSFGDPLQYIRCFTHVMGHSSWDHLFNNLLYILLLGPMLEEKYGGIRLILLMAFTALITGLFNIIFMPGTALLGASGVVFMMILLCSYAAVKDGGLPITVLLVAAVYLGREIYNGLFTADNISQLAHLLGGLVGAVAGPILNKKRR